MRHFALLALLPLLLAAADPKKILQDFKFGTTELREAALDEMIALPIAGSEDALLEGLQEATGTVKLKLMRALGNAKADRAVGPLSALLEDPVVEFRVQAARSLGRISDPSAAPALAKALKDGDADVREAAARALGACKASKQVDALLALLKDGNRLLKLAAVDALGAIGDRKAFPALKSELDDKDPAYKRHVVKAIGSLQGGTDLDGLLRTWLTDKDPYLRAFTAEALSRRPRSADLEARLLELLDDPVLAVKIRAIETLGVWKTRAAVKGLQRFLRESFATTRWKAVVALGQIGDRSSEEALGYVAENDDEDEIRRAASVALGRLEKNPAP